MTWWQDAHPSLLRAEPVAPLGAVSVAKPGIYAWWDLAGALDLFRPEGCPPYDWSRPVYVGKANRSIGGRFEHMHIAVTRRSSLRRSLASLLWQELDLLPGVTNAGSGKMILAPKEEERLTTWMLENLTVTWVQLSTSPAPIEKELICDLSPLLNDTYAVKSPYRLSIRLARAKLCDMAEPVHSDRPVDSTS